MCAYRPDRRLWRGTRASHRSSGPQTDAWCQWTRPWRQFHCHHGQKYGRHAPRRKAKTKKQKWWATTYCRNGRKSAMMLFWLWFQATVPINGGGKHPFWKSGRNLESEGQWELCRKGDVKIRSHITWGLKTSVRWQMMGEVFRWLGGRKIAHIRAFPRTKVLSQLFWGKL